MPDSVTQTELYQLAEDFIRLQMRLTGVGLRLLPRDSREHAVNALREAFEGARATTRHFGGLIDEELAGLSRQTSSPDVTPARKVHVVREDV